MYQISVGFWSKTLRGISHDPNIYCLECCMYALILTTLLSFNPICPDILQCRIVLKAGESKTLLSDKEKDFWHTTVWTWTKLNWTRSVFLVGDALVSCTSMFWVLLDKNISSKFIALSLMRVVEDVFIDCMDYRYDVGIRFV